MTKDPKEWEQEYAAFMDASDKAVPAHLESRVMSRIQNALRPSNLGVFLRLSLVHLVSGTLTLLVCPQFGVGPIGGWLDLMQMVMPLGSVACALFCGVLYLSATALASHLVLSESILRGLYHTRLRHFALLGAISMGVLMFLVSPFPVHQVDLSFSAFWWIGGVLVSQWIFRLLFEWRGLRLDLAGR